MVPVTAFVLHRTRIGLRLRATGAAEATVRAVGLKPLNIRDASSVFAGAMAGLAGAQSVDRGRWFVQRGNHRRARLHRAGGVLFRPQFSRRTALGAVLFGFFDAAQIRLQGRGMPAELVQTLPYIIVIVVLVGLGFADVRRSRERVT